MARRLVLLGAAFLVMTGCTSGPLPQLHGGRISGRVTVAGESTPVAGAKVEVGITSLESGVTASAVTDPNGAFSMQASWFETYENPPGMVSMVMKVTKPDFETLLRQAVAFSPDGVYYPLTLTPTSTCTWPVEIAATSGAYPTFSWTPPCHMWRVLVKSDSLGEEHWRLDSYSGNIISPPLYFGSHVAGTNSSTTAALTPGRRYVVTVFRWTGPGAADADSVGQLTFIP